MQCVCGFHTAKPFLAALHSEAFVANIDKDVIPAVEGTKWYPTLNNFGCHLDHLLYYQHSLLELFTRKLEPRLRVDTYSAFFTQDLSRKM